MSYTLRDYQSESCNSAWHGLINNSGNQLIFLPTGAGKSLVIAELCRKAVQDYKGRVIVVQHRKELIEQNSEKIKSLLPFGVTCGVFSAGLRRFSMDDDVICGGIQSIYKRAADFGRRQLVIIDEAHLVPDTGDGMFRKFIDDLGSYNPRLKIIGLTATPYRTSTGLLYGPDKLFSRVCYSAKIPALIEQGYLSPITTTPTKELYDTSKLHTRAGEFIASEVEDLFDDDGKTREACGEIIEKCHGRKSILIFSSGVAHAEHIAKIITQLTGEPCGCVTGEMLPLERESTLSRFKAQSLRWLVNVDVLTTGFDAPCIDSIAVLRATQSPGLFAQICGRGFRLHPSKKDCLIIDYGNNIKRFGPLDSDSYGEKKKTVVAEREPLEGGPGTKQCPTCNANVSIATKVCECGWLFANIDTFSDSQSQILAKPEKWLVQKMFFSRHRKKLTSDENKPDTLRVNYTVEPFASGGDMAAREISEWVCLEHEGFAHQKALKWWKQHSLADLTDDGYDSPIDGAQDLFARGAVANVLTITTMKDGHFYRIIEREIDDLPEEWLPVEEPKDATGVDEWGQPVYETGNEDIPF